MVYLPMSYLYGKRFVGPITPKVLSLRQELYTVPYHEIDWNKSRNTCAKVTYPPYSISYFNEEKNDYIRYDSLGSGPQSKYVVRGEDCWELGEESHLSWLIMGL